MTPRLNLLVAHLAVGTLCLGLALSLALRAGGWAPAVLSLALCGGAAVVSRARLALLLAALLLAGLWWGGLRLDRLEASVLAGEAGGAAPATLEVTGPARLSRFAARVPVRVRRFDGRAVDEPAQLELPITVRAPPQGARLEAVVQVELPPGPDEAGGIDEAAYLARRGAHVVLEAGSYRIVGQRGGIAGAADRLRAWLARSLAPGIEGERRALVAGVVLGEDEGLDETLRDRFRSSGLYHLLAVSGQNIAYVVAGVLILCWLVGLTRRTGQLAALVCVTGYVAAVGWQPSVVRAGVAGGLASLAWLTGRARDRWYFLLVGAAVLLAWNPMSLLEPGFQLSFAAVAAIFLCVPRLERLLAGYPVPRALAAVLAVSAACGAATAPILLAHFGAIPVFSIAANMLAAPVVAPILGLGLGAAALAPLLPSAAAGLAWVNGWLAAYLAWCARAVGGLPHAQVGSAAGLAVLCGGIALVAVTLRAAPRRRRLLLLGLALAAACTVAAWRAWPSAPPPPPPTGLRLTFLDVGQGDAALLEVPEGAILVDEGPPEAGVAGLLARRGIRSLVAIVLTHPQRDHVGGAGTVLERMPVGNVLDPRLPADSADERAALAAAAARGVPVITARAGQRFQLGRLRLRVLWPDGPGRRGDDPNDHAVVLEASYGQVDALLTADAESGVTGRLALGQVEILKVAHHGSADPGLSNLLDRLEPRVAVISVGTGNDYGHPAPSTVAALERVPGLAVYRTDRDGTVVIDTDGRTFSVRPSR